MKWALVIQTAFIAVASFGAFTFVRAARNDERVAACGALCELHPAYAGRNRLAPDFELPDLSGTPVRFSSFWGRPVVLNFWTQNCKPCLAELPSIAQLAVRGRAEGFSVVTVCADEGPDAVRETLAQLFGDEPPPFPILFDPDLTVILGKYGTSLYPETWLLDRAHVIRSRFDGERDWDSALAREALSLIDRPLGCAVEFERGNPVGPLAALCPSR
jgi:thiol-disulfide isomerase/thioredoxin